MQKPSAKALSPGEVLSETELKTIAQRALTRAFPKNAVVVSEGDSTDSL